MAASADPFVQSGMAVVLAKRLREAVGRVGIEEFRGQDDRFDHHSRLGRELLYLASNDEWIRTTRETVTLDAADTVATTVQLHVDIGRIQHETFRNRQERLWLPLVVLPPPVEPVQDDADDGGLFRAATLFQATPRSQGSHGPGGAGVALTPVASDQSGADLPVLPQAEARRWIAAALAEIILNMAPLRMDGPRPKPVARELAREQRLLLSAALYRLLQRRAGAGEFSAHPEGAGLDPDGPLEASRARLAKMLDLVIKTLQGGRPVATSGRYALSASDRADVADRAALVMQRAARIVYAVSSPTTLVVVAAPPTALSTLYTVELPSRPLHSQVPHWRGPRAHLSIDALLPGTEADRSIVVRLPEGVSFTGQDGGAHPRGVRATVEGVQPRSLRQVVDLIGQLRQSRGLLPDPVARCLVDFTLARMETARDAFRHYRTTPEAARTGEAGQVDSVPAWLDDVRHGLEEIRAESEGSAAELARTAAARAPSDLSDTDTLYRINDGAAVSPHRAHIQMTAVENRTVRATPVAATLDLEVVADRSAPLHAARYSGYMSLLLLTAVLVCWLVISRPRPDTDPSKFPDAQVLASVLTLFAAVQASRIQHPERATLRGLLISSGSWLVIASILPTVLLGVILAFDHSSTGIVVAAVALQAAVQVLMYLPPLTGQPWRWRALGVNLVGRPPRLRLTTGPAPDYRRTAVLLSSWWRSTTAAALQLGTDAYGYLVPQHGSGVLDLLGHGTPSGTGGNGNGNGGNGNGSSGASSAPVTATRRAAARAPWVNRGLDLLATRLPKAITSLAEPPPQPANILAMLRAGAPGRTVTFIVFREDPQPEWQQHTRVPVDLDIDRLIAQEAPITELDVYIGLAGTGLRTIEHHPVRRFLVLARHRRLQIPSVQFPAAPPPAGAADRHWTKITIGLRSSEISGLAGLLCGILDRVRDDAGEAVDLFVDMSTQTPPRRFLGAGGPDESRPAVAMSPSGLDVPNGLDHSGGEWLTLALCDYAQDGGEARLLRVMERDYPGLELGGLTIARLFGTTAVFALGRRRAAPGPGPGPATARGRAPQRVLLEEPASVEELGSLPEDGVLLDVRARYSDRPGIFSELLEVLRRTLSRIVDHGFDPSAMHILHLNTSVADGRNAVSTFTLSLPGPASGVHFTPDVLDRVEREARRALLTPPTDPAGDDLGLVHAVRVAIDIELVTVQPPAAPSPQPVIDLTEADRPITESNYSDTKGGDERLTGAS